MTKRLFRNTGYTLIELMIVASIVIILTLVSTVLYTSYAKKSRRNDGINSILSISLAEEEYRAQNTTYGTLAQVWSGVSTSTEGYYTLAISNVTASSYTITATTTGAQTGDSADGTSCNTLTLTMSNGTITKTPAVCWPS